MRYADGGELHGARVAKLAFPQPILEGAPLRDVVDCTDDRCGLTILVDPCFYELLDDLLASIREHDSALDRISRGRSQRPGHLTFDQHLAIVGMDLGNEVVERGWVTLRIFLEDSIELL